jgi:hypothetical protein
MDHMAQAELDDQESLVPHSHTILGLKVADAEEALTVRRVGTAVLGLMVVLVIHFIVHVAHDGNVVHALGHLAFSAALPGVGYVAVSQRSTKATWAFHMVAVLSAVIHGALLIAVLRHFAEAELNLQEGALCAKMSHPCAEEYQNLELKTFSADRSVWRCAHGYCIHGENHCDGKFNCFDHSDEALCSRLPPEMSLEEQALMRRCEEMALRHMHSPTLKVWWIMVTLPMWALCIFAAYYSLEFYVQLRLRKLSARVDRATAQATIFERGEDPDQVAE